MSGLSQMQVSFSDVEDRIMLRINTLANEEFRFWLTRRFVKRLFPVINDTIMATPEIAAQDTHSNREAVLDFQREQAAQNADFATPFLESDSDVSYPLGSGGVLIVKGKLQQEGRDNFSLSLKNKSNRGIDFMFTIDILYLLQKLLQDALRKTDWDLNRDSTYQLQISPENTQRTLN